MSKEENVMKKFRVPVKFEITTTVSGFVTISANSEDEAINAVENLIQDPGKTSSEIYNKSEDLNSFEAEDSTNAAHEYLRRGYVNKFEINTDYTPIEELDSED